MNKLDDKFMINFLNIVTTKREMKEEHSKEELTILKRTYDSKRAWFLDAYNVTVSEKADEMAGRIFALNHACCGVVKGTKEINEKSPEHALLTYVKSSTENYLAFLTTCSDMLNDMRIYFAAKKTSK